MKNYTRAAQFRDAAIEALDSGSHDDLCSQGQTTRRYPDPKPCDCWRRPLVLALGCDLWDEDPGWREGILDGLEAFIQCREVDPMLTSRLGCAT